MSLTNTIFGINPKYKIIAYRSAKKGEQYIPESELKNSPENQWIVTAMADHHKDRKNYIVVPKHPGVRNVCSISQ